MAVRVFIHGLESSNQGTKSVFFRKNYPDMIIPHFTGSLRERLTKLNSILSNSTEIRFVGSSFGGLMATVFAMENAYRVDRLILLAPAINLLLFTPCKIKPLSMPVWIYHGKNDEVIPIFAVKQMAEKSFRNLTFQKVDDDHFLHKTFKTINWDTLL